MVFTQNEKGVKLTGRIAFYGLGPVGLVSAVCFARRGYSVAGVDPDQGKIAAIRRGEPPFFEKSLREYLGEATGTGNLSVSDESPETLDADFVFVAVGTPSRRDGSIDLSFVKNASRSIGRAIRKSKGEPVIVVKSTVTPGATRNIVKPILEEQSRRKAGVGFRLCTNPEFLREGNAIQDTEFPDRIVIGSEDEESAFRLEELYKGFYGERMPPVVRTSYENAELVKYASNAYLAMKVSYINMIANLCQRVPQADVEEVAKGIGLDERIGPSFLRAGLGWGGSCFPKDLAALRAFAKQRKVKVPLIQASMDQNSLQPLKALDLAQEALGSLKGKRVALLGLAFKPNTDDIRGAVSIPLVNGLLARKAKVVAYDPAASNNANALFRNRVRLANSSLEALEGADCCIIVTEWDEFKDLRPEDFVQRMKRPVVIDGRRIFDASRFRRGRVELVAIGFGPRDNLRS